MVGFRHVLNERLGDQPPVGQLDPWDFASADQSSGGFGVNGQDFGRLSSGDIKVGEILHIVIIIFARNIT